MNQTILYYLNNLVHRWSLADNVATFLIQWSLWIIAALIILVFLFGLLNKNDKQRTAAFNTGVLVLLCLAIGSLIGHFFHETRPMYALSNITELLPHVDDSSFPSDHMLICFAAAFGFFAWRQWLGALLVFFGLFVGLAKIYAAQHYPLDILWTIVLVAVIAIIYQALISRWVKKGYRFIDRKVLAPLYPKKHQA